MEQKAIQILNDNRVMAITTMGADGWPHATMVSYANDGLIIYFAISCQGEKFRNIQHDDRCAIVIGRDFHDPATIKALSIKARVSDVRDGDQRRRAMKMLLERHPGLSRLEPPDPTRCVVMRANCQQITILDYSKGFGHADILTVGPSGLAAIAPARDDDWGFGKALKPVS